MSRPLVIEGALQFSGGYQVAVQLPQLREASNSQMSHMAWKILCGFTDSDTNAGSLGVTTGSIPAGSVSIGSFTDTRRDDATGTHPAGTTISSTTYTFYQYTAVETEDYIRPLSFDTTLDAIQEQSNSELDDHIIQMALNMMLNTSNHSGLGQGQYVLQHGSPSGTSDNQGTIYDTVVDSNGNATASGQASLWKRTRQIFGSNQYGYESPTSNPRPLKIDSSTTPASIKEMSDDEIEGLVKRFSNKIISSGIGTYVVQEDAPASGTWVQRGSNISDDRRELADETYTGSYGGFFAGSRTYSGNYSGTYTGTYTGSYVSPNSYAGGYLGAATAFYGGRPYYFNTYYTGYYAAVYSGDYSGDYTGSYAGSREYSGNYGGTFSGDYTGATVQTSTESISNVKLWQRTA